MASVCQHNMRVLRAPERSWIVPSRPARSFRRIVDQNVDRCGIVGSQFVPHCAAAHTTCLASPLPEAASHSARRSLQRIAWSLSCVGLAVLAVSVACSIRGNSGMLASMAGSSLRLQNHLAVTSAASGLAAGFLHTLCGPDHLAALTPLTIGRDRFSASLLGSLWGLGHSIGQLALGLGFVLLKAQFTVVLPFLERWAGTIVGLTLLTIGGLGIYESVFEQDEGGENQDEAKLRDITAKGTSGEVKVAAATLGTGVLYGLQPDSLFVIIPALALPSTLAAFTYCMMFVIGTVLAMGGYTLFLGTASEELCRDRPWLQQNLSIVASCVAIAVGILVLLSSFGFAVPLFS